MVVELRLPVDEMMAREGDPLAAAAASHTNALVLSSPLDPIDDGSSVAPDRCTYVSPSDPLQQQQQQQQHGQEGSRSRKAVAADADGGSFDLHRYVALICHCMTEHSPYSQPGGFFVSRMGENVELRGDARGGVWTVLCVSCQGLEVARCGCCLSDMRRRLFEGMRARGRSPEAIVSDLLAMGLEFAGVGEGDPHVPDLHDVACRYPLVTPVAAAAAASVAVTAVRPRDPLRERLEEMLKSLGESQSDRAPASTTGRVVEEEEGARPGETRPPFVFESRPIGGEPAVAARKRVPVPKRRPRVPHRGTVDADNRVAMLPQQRQQPRAQPEQQHRNRPTADPLRLSHNGRD